MNHCRDGRIGNSFIDIRKSDSNSTCSVHRISDSIKLDEVALVDLTKLLAVESSSHNVTEVLVS